VFSASVSLSCRLTPNILSGKFGGIFSVLDCAFVFAYIKDDLVHGYIHVAAKSRIHFSYLKSRFRRTRSAPKEWLQSAHLESRDIAGLNAGFSGAQWVRGRRITHRFGSFMCQDLHTEFS
jgi:hypothetical protein